MDFRRRATGLAALALTALFAGVPLAGISLAGERPHAVSLDYCADQYLIALAGPDQLLAVSPNATSEYSFLAEEAEGLPSLRASAEEVLVMAPDIAIRQFGGESAILPMLERLGIEVVQLGFSDSPESARSNLRLVGRALGREARAEALIADMDRRLAEVAARGRGGGLTAIYLTPGGFTSGAGTFIDAVIRSAGLTNLGAAGGRQGWYDLNIENLVMNPPDLIIGSFFDLRTSRMNHWSVARHSYVRKLLEERPSVIVPGRYVACSAWFFVEAVEMIDRALAADPRLSGGGS
jgi:iron complex transport system substrate-binding protein